MAARRKVRAVHRTTVKRGRGRPGRKPGFHHSPATRKKMAAARRAWWKTHGHKGRKTAGRKHTARKTTHRRTHHRRRRAA